MYSIPIPCGRYIRIRICKRTGHVYHRNRRSSSQLEGYHLHLRAAQHPCAKSSGLRLEMARTNYFDFVWNVKAAVAANVMVDHGHFHLWLVDALADVCRGWRDEGHTARPAALRSWQRTDTMVEPIMFRGIDSAQLRQLKEQGAQALELAPLRSEEELRRVLAHPQLVARADAAGIARVTGVLTSEKRLRELAERLKQTETVRMLLRAHGVQNLQNRVRATDGGLAPSAPVDPAAAPARDASAEAGPLPLDTVRLPPVQAAATIEQPPPLLVVEDAELSDTGEEMGQQGDEDEEMGQQGDEDEEMGQQGGEGNQGGEGEGRREAVGLGPKPPKEDTEAWARRRTEQKKQQKARALRREADNAVDPGVAKPFVDARRWRRGVCKRKRDEESNADGDAADVLVGLGIGS